MDSTLTLLRDLAEQQEYQALYHACCEQLLQAETRPVQLLLSLAYAQIGEQEAARALLHRVQNSVVSSSLPCSLSFLESQDLSAIYLALSEQENAESVLDELLQQSPDNALLIARKAYCRLMQHDRLAAYDLYRRAFALDNSKVEIAINLCLLLLANQTDKDAAFLSDTSLVMTQIQSYLAQADHQFERNQDRYSAAHCQHLRSQLNGIRIESWLLEGKLAHAEHWLQTQFNDLIEYRDNVLLLADQLCQMGARFTAEAVLLVAAKQSPHEPVFYQQLAELSHQQSHHADAAYYQAQYRTRALRTDSADRIYDARDDLSDRLPLLDFQHSERVRARFTPAFWASRMNETHLRENGACSQMHRSVFIVGVPFSGISLLEQWLMCVPNVSSVGVSAHFPVLVEGLNRQHRKKGSERAYPDVMDSITTEYLHELALGVESLYQRKCPSATWVIDRSVHNIQHLGLIKAVFPNAKIIAVRRDPRALALSNSVAEWLLPHLETSLIDQTDAKTQTAGEKVAFLLGRQLAQYNTLMGHWKSLFSESICDVSFEELTSNSHAMAARLSAFLEFPQLTLTEADQQSKVLASFTQYASEDASIKWSIHRQTLAALLRAMNQKSLPPSQDMATLPEPDLLVSAYESYRQGAYRDAEYQCKVILHHVADFAPAHYLLGEIYLRNGLIALGIDCLKDAIRLAPWKRHDWEPNLIHAMTLMPPKMTPSQYRRDQG